jgi:hypothetical protein
LISGRSSRPDNAAAAADSVKIQANYGEFTALYNRTLNLMRGALNHPREVAGGQ